VMAWLGFTLPSALALVAFAYGLRMLEISDAGWLHGLKVAAVAVVALAVWGMARSLAPDRERTDRLRIRCRTQLGRSRRYRMRTNAFPGFRRSAVGPIVFAAFCLLYVVGLGAAALRLHRLVQ